jgi:acylphosphatase
VRNRRDGSVEAVFGGGAVEVAAMLDACRRGPPASRVDDLATADRPGPVQEGFTVLPTA